MQFIIVTDQSVKQPFMKSSHLHLKPEIIKRGLIFRIGKYISTYYKNSLDSNKPCIQTPALEPYLRPIHTERKRKQK